MRILHVTREVASDRRFGLGRSLLPVVQALQAAGHEVQYLSQEHLGPRALAAGVQLRKGLSLLGHWRYGGAGRDMASPWAERLGMGRLAAKLARQDGYDVVHLHDPWIAFGYQQASRWLYPVVGRRVRWGYTEHGFGSYAHATREEGVSYTPALLARLLQLELRVGKAADFVVCPTAAALGQLARDLDQPQPPAHWKVLPHGRPELALPGRGEARAALGLADDLPLVLAVGRINPVKRLDRIVAACALLQQPLRLVLLAGGGDPAPLHRAAAAAPGLQLDVRQVDDVAPWLAAADVYVSAALNESFGLANLEAMAAGLPAVCTAVGGVPEVMGEAAWLVSGIEGDLVRGLAHAIGTLLADAPRRSALQQAARQRAAAWPTAPEIGSRHEALYQGLA